jgi:hypothetical protein
MILGQHSNFKEAFFQNRIRLIHMKNKRDVLT